MFRPLSRHVDQSFYVGYLKKGYDSVGQGGSLQPGPVSRWADN